MRSRGLFLVSILLAAALRFPHLASRPMHADEAIHADKFGTLLEGRGYAYDPSEYHGPTLYYLTLLSAWLRGESRYVEIDEYTLRSVPAALGVLLVAAHFGARGFLGGPGAAVAALLAALSPAMVFYNRYFIHETPLVFLSLGALLGACHYLRAPGVVPAVLTGACAGLMLATKETALLALGCMLLAFASTRFSDRRHEETEAPLSGGVPVRHALVALLAALVLSAVLLSSFLTRPEGLLDAVRAYGFYLDRARTASSHFHPWPYYLQLLIHYPANGTPFWTEGLILILAALGGASAFTGKAPAGADPRVLRFLAYYTVLMVGTYSAIPYKTPWCLLGFLQGMVLLAGCGAVVLVRSVRSATRAFVIVVLVSAAAHLGWQAFCASFRFASDPRNPYVYAHTSTDVFEIVGRLKDLARAHPDGSSLSLQVISRENLWPLPFYLRGWPRVQWWTGVPESAPSAPVILVTPDMEPALVRKLYDLPPPGERELYVSLFERPLELRPAVEVRGYVANRVWEDFRRAESEPAAQPREVRE